MKGLDDKIASLQVEGCCDLVKETRGLWKTISQTHPAALARSHSLYEDYAAKKMDRDSLAAENVLSLERFQALQSERDTLALKIIDP